MYDAIFCGCESQRIGTAIPEGTTPTTHSSGRAFTMFIIGICLRNFSQNIHTQVYHYQPQLPRVDVKCDECQVTVGKVTKVKIMFRNSLSRSVSRLLFLVQAQGLFAQKKLSYR